MELISQWHRCEPVIVALRHRTHIDTYAHYILIVFVTALVNYACTVPASPLK